MNGSILKNAQREAVFAEPTVVPGYDLGSHLANNQVALFRSELWVSWHSGIGPEDPTRSAGIGGSKERRGKVNTSGKLEVRGEKSTLAIT